MKTSKTFAYTFCSLRKAKGLSQTDVARLLNVNQASISRWEKGVGAPSAPMLDRIAEIFETDAEELLASAKKRRIWS